MGLGIQTLYRTLHGKHAGMQNIDRIDFLDTRLRDAEGQGVTPNHYVQFVTLRLIKELRVQQAGDRFLRVQDHSCRHHRARQWPTAYLIDACNQVNRTRSWLDVSALWRRFDAGG